MTYSLGAGKGVRERWRRQCRWRWWYWAALPLLAIIAYITVLRIGFLGDDFLLLGLAKEPGIDFGALLPGSRWFFYRPVGVMFTWELGWHLWGYNPFPYHLVQLLMHAGVSLLLGLWLSYVTGRRMLGWLAGAIFAVFPSHGEAVGWIATQWDLLSALLGIGGLWCFTAWWRTRNQAVEGANSAEGAHGSRQRWGLYAASLLLYTLATLTKEGLFTFVLMLGISAWFVAPPRKRAEWGRLTLALLPFFLVIGANVALRFERLGGLGNYPTARTDYGDFIWDSLLLYMRFFLAPLNPALWGNAWVQVVGLLSTVAIIVGVARYGRTQGRTLLLAALWLLLAITPVLNLPIMGKDDFRDTRFLYLPAAGYCIGLAALLYGVLASVKRWRTLAAIAVSVMLGGGVVASWIQVSPWRIATEQANGIVAELLAAIPPQPRPNGMVWLVENVPQIYKGALMLNWGLGLSRVFTNEKADYPRLERVPDAAQALAASDPRDAYGIRFQYVQSPGSEDKWELTYLGGITGMAPPPTGGEVGESSLVWDFRGCAARAVGGWSANGASASCEPGKGLVLEPNGNDPQITSSPLDVAMPDGATFVRLRVAARYREATSKTPYVSEWFWKGRAADYGAGRQRATPIRQDGETHVYWTFLPASEVGQTLTGLRFDPVDGEVRCEISWIAVDVVK